MSRPAKRISVENVAWVAEYLVSRVNRADWKLHLHAPEKRDLGNDKNPKSEVYRLAAQAVDLQKIPVFGREQAWLDSLESLLERVNEWVDDYLDSQDRTRLWTAHRVAQSRNIDPSDLMVRENYEQIIADKQQELEI